MNADITKDGLLYGDITFKVRAVCFEVWRQFGGAFKELVIDKALTIALKKQRLDVKDQVKTNIFFEGENVGVYVPDKVINDVVLVELSRAKIGVNFGFISKAQNISSVC